MWNLGVDHNYAWMNGNPRSCMQVAGLFSKGAPYLGELRDMRKSFARMLKKKDLEIGKMMNMERGARMMGLPAFIPISK